MVSANPRRRILATGIAAVLPLFLYLLSLGPALKLTSEQPDLRPWLVVYSPVFIAARNMAWVDEGLHWYCGDVWNVPSRSQDWGH